MDERINLDELTMERIEKFKKILEQVNLPEAVLTETAGTYIGVFPLPDDVKAKISERTFKGTQTDMEILEERNKLEDLLQNQP